jgi:hypothetical protein
MKVVLVRMLPPAGPGCEPMDWRSRHGIEAAFGQLGSEPAGIEFAFMTCAQTLLVSRACQVALPKGNGLGAASLGLASGLRK